MEEKEIAQMAAEAAVEAVKKLEVEKKPLPGEGDSEPETKFKSLGEFLCTIKNNPLDVRLKGLSEGVDSEGGFTVPEEYVKGIYKRAIEKSVVRQFARIMPMATDTLNYPTIAETSHASHLYGGCVAYWTEEKGDKTESQPVFGRVKLIAKKLAGLFPASDELLEDSAIALEAMLVQLAGDTIAWYEDYAFLRGSGVGQPLGIFGSGAFLNPNRATANLISMTDLGNIMRRMYPASLYGPNTVWIANQATLGQLLALSTTCVNWISHEMGATKRIPSTIFGMPLIFTEKVPTLGTTGDIGLYDLSYYLIGDRKGLKIDRSTEYKFVSDETTWRFVKRVDGHALVDSAFTPKNGSTISPFVALYGATTGGD